jgi:hypothetical protein
MRIYPGVLIFIALIYGVFYLSWSSAEQFIFGDYIALCKDFITTYMTVMQKDIADHKDYFEIIENYEIPIT